MNDKSNERKVDNIGRKCRKTEKEAMTQRKFNAQNIPLFVLLIVASFAATFVMVAKNVSEVFRWLPVMPAVFALCLFLGIGISDRIINNIGVLFIIAMLFVKMVLSPMLIILGNYNVALLPNYADNIDKAIILMCYECVALFAAMWIYVYKHPLRSISVTSRIDRLSWKLSKSYLSVIFLLIIIAIGCLFIVPQITLSFRTIFQIGDKSFSSFEFNQVVEQYGTTFIKKLACVVGNNVIVILRFLVPATVMIFTTKFKSRRLRKAISLCCIAVPLLIIDGTIARSLFYCLALFWLHAYLYWKFNYTKVIVALVFAGIAVFAYWLIRFYVNNPGGDLYSYFSKTINAYFSGVNITAGVFNMDRSLLVRAKYFIYDYLKAIPFGNTLFGLDATDTPSIFNEINSTIGQIPPTIGLGYYYFGWIFAPLYSLLLGIIGMLCADKINSGVHPLNAAVCLLTIIYMALGIGMYSYSAVVANIVGKVIPMVLIIYFTRGKVKYI